jgi:hypothetical protein
LKCYEDDITNRLTESLKTFSEMILNFNSGIEIIFTKKDILIEKIKNGGDFSKLKEFGFDKEITFKNIVEFHIELFSKIIIENSKNLENYHFYCGNLIDYNDSIKLYKNVMDQIIYKKYSSIDFSEFQFLTFDCFDLIFIYM